MTRFLDEKETDEKENSDEEDYVPEIIQVEKVRADRDDEFEASDEDESLSPVSSNSPRFSKSPQQVQREPFRLEELRVSAPQMRLEAHDSLKFFEKLLVD